MSFRQGQGATDDRLRQLMWENRRLREERDVLKKAVAILSRVQ